MPFEFKLPDLGEGVAEGEVVRWLVREGDMVAEDQPLAEVLTDKATVEIPSPRAGRVTRLGASEGQRMFTAIRGKHQSLPNGNLLITETDPGRVFEVNSRGEVVWEFINRYDEENVVSVTQATRYADSYFTVGDWSCP